MGTSNGFLIGEFIGTTSLGGFPFPIFFLIKGSIPIFCNVRKTKRKKASRLSGILG
jgi:hypothetical protein